MRGWRLLVTAGVATAALGAGLQRQSARQVVDVGFWFSGVTYDVPRLPANGMEPLTTAEQETIQRVARAEVERAFAGLRVRVTDSRRAHYRVSVEQVFQGRFQGAAGSRRFLHEVPSQGFLREGSRGFLDAGSFTRVPSRGFLHAGFFTRGSFTRVDEGSPTGFNASRGGRSRPFDQFTSGCSS